MDRACVWIIALVLIVGIDACDKKEPPRPPQTLINVTVARVAARDLPVIETAVGAETWVAEAESYDPTRDLTRRIHIRLPFPRDIVRHLKIGQPITLTNFGDNRKTTGVIREIRPALSTLTQTVEVIAEIRNPGTWRPAGSVRGEVVLDVHRNALVVPEQAVVLRPAGAVVYTIEAGIAHARPVKTGIVREGVIEILEGLKVGETVAVDGAALLSDGAGVRAGSPATDATGAGG
jgi:membrane fusion protein (multidrug efflux system)